MRKGNVDRPPRIERLKVKNFRALRDVELKDLTPLTVLVGPNGSGKSTVFDVFAFLAESFDSGLRRAWERRGRARELKSRGREGPVSIEIAYRERPDMPLITYHLEFDENDNRPAVVSEWLRWKRGSYGRPFKFLEYAGGTGSVIPRELPERSDDRIEVPLSSPDALAAMRSANLQRIPVSLRFAISSWDGMSPVFRPGICKDDRRRHRKSASARQRTIWPTSSSTCRKNIHQLLSTSSNGSGNGSQASRMWKQI